MSRRRHSERELNDMIETSKYSIDDRRATIHSSNYVRSFQWLQRKTFEKQVMLKHKIIPCWVSLRALRCRFTSFLPPSWHSIFPLLLTGLFMQQHLPWLSGALLIHWVHPKLYEPHQLRYLVGSLSLELSCALRLLKRCLFTIQRTWLDR